MMNPGVNVGTGDDSNNNPRTYFPAHGDSTPLRSTAFTTNPPYDTSSRMQVATTPVMHNVPGLYDPEDLLLKRFEHQVVEGTPQQADHPRWLQTSKGYWTLLRERKKLQKSESPSKVAIDWTRIPRYCAECVVTTPDVGVACEDIDLSSDRMYMSGFAAIAKVLPWIHPGDVSMTIWGLESFDKWYTLRGPSNPSFTYDNVPMPGWQKNVSVRMGGKTQGTLEVSFTPPDGKRRLRNKIELTEYLTRTCQSTNIASRFDFRGVYCVCHEHEDGGSYLECSFGRAGCHGWLHPQCVGLGRRGEHELRQMATVVCPFCTIYLDSIGAHEFLRGKLYVGIMPAVYLFT